MVAQMQLQSQFFGSSSAFANRSTPVRPRARCIVRAEKASSAGTWLPGVESPSWLEEADLPANRGSSPFGLRSKYVGSRLSEGCISCVAHQIDSLNLADAELTQDFTQVSTFSTLAQTRAD